MSSAPPRLIVAGSLNLDLMLRVEHLPLAGEAVAASSLQRDLGGKGFNQAVAARRLGAQVEMIGAVGRDQPADQFLARLDRLQIGRSGVRRVETATGMAVPVVDPSGQNWIVVALGANLELRPQHVDAELLQGAAGLLLQGELLPETNTALARRAREAGVRLVVNAAPASGALEAMAGLADVVVVNQVEAAAFGGPARLLSLGAGQVVVTLGAAGASLHGPVEGSVPAPAVTAVDTTGAGDAFVAALAVALVEGKPFREAAAWAAAAGAAACMRPGTSSSMPDRRAVAAVLPSE